jgi:hypothetical protein
MHSPYTPRPMLDLVVSQRIFNACWLSASLGISILQMHLLAETWHISQHALVPAGLMSAWTLGALVGMRLRAATRACGAAALAGALFWLESPSVVMWHLPFASVPSAWMSLAALTLLAAFLGASSTAWLTQQRTWPAAGERTFLVRSLLGLTVGLVVAWLLPNAAGFIGLVCCLPLFILDAGSFSCDPLPTRGGVAAAWMRRYWRADLQSLQVEQRAQPIGQVWNWLVECSQSSRGYLPFTLLTSGIAVILGSVWGAVPTPFAAGLFATHDLEKLDWLLGGQTGVVLLGACLLLFAARGVIGFPDRLVPPSWQAPARLMAGTAPLGMAAALAALGMPFLQTPWWLAVSLAGYTLASAVWGLLLPRLRPTMATLAQSQRHLLLAQGRALPSPLHLAHAGAREAQVTRLLATVEGLLIAVLTPLLGWWIDVRNNVDPVLVSVGLGFLGLLLAVRVLAALPQRREGSPRRAVFGATRFTAPSAALHLARQSW